MVRCNATTLSDKRCRRDAEEGKTKCWQHTPKKKSPSKKKSSKKKKTSRGHYGDLEQYEPKLKPTEKDKTRKKKCTLKKTKRGCNNTSSCKWKNNKCVAHFVRFN